MQRFKNILVFLDGGKGERHAIEQSAKLALSNKANLTLFDVLEQGSSIHTRAELMASVQALQEQMLQVRKTELAKLAAGLKEQYGVIHAKSTVRRGQPAIELIRHVLREQHDLVIKAADGQAGKFHALFGSTELKILRKCPCPVWLIKPSRRKRITRILAAVDLSAKTRDKASLDRQIMTLASSLASRDQSELHVVHAWTSAIEQKLRGRQIFSADVDRLMISIASACKEQFDGLLAEFPNSYAKEHFIRGEPKDVILRFVEEHKVDLVVLGTVARVGLPGFFIGNTAESILNAVDCSVLAIKPDGFETPVQIAES